MSHPTDNLVRAWVDPDATVLRAGATADGNTMVGHFAVFNSWTRIASAFEGTFMERIAPGAFDDTFRSKASQIRVLYDHGADPQVGNKPLGTPEVLREDGTGAYYEVSLFDSSYVNELKPALRAGQLGSSFRFKVLDEQWHAPSERTADNPEMLEERTITAVDLYEFGPVTFPAYADATAGLRSRTDEFIEHFLSDPKFVARFTERAGLATTERILATLPPTAQRADNVDPVDDETSDESADGDENDTLQRRAAFYESRTAGFIAHLSRLKETS
jgi:HK97 family phage prohead protease